MRAEGESVLDQIEAAVNRSLAAGSWSVADHALLRNHAADLIAVARAAQALHEVVEMDESVGVCLSSRAESLSLGEVLASAFEDTSDES